MIDGMVTVCLLITGALVALSGLLSALESASLTANRNVLRDLEAAGDSKAADALAMLRNTRRILAASLTGNLLTLIAAAGFFKMALSRMLPKIAEALDLPDTLWWLASPSLWTALILPPLFLVFGELAPRHWCRKRPDAFIRLSTGAAKWLVGWWMPMAETVARWVTRGFHAIGLHGALEPVSLTREDLRSLLEEPASVSTLASPGTQRGMIRSILSLGGTLVREVMRPLGEVVAIRLGDMTPAQVVEFSKRHKFTRYPVYRERMIDFIGYVNIYDLLAEEDLENRRLEDFLHEPLFVPETARVNALLHQFLRHKVHCAVVFDEHGSCSGWVTREDVLEQIVGDLDVEGDPALRQVTQEAEGVFRVNPRMDIDDLNRLLDVALEKSHCETVGGYVYSVLGRVPAPGERIYLLKWILEIVEIDRHIIRSLRMIRRPDRFERSETSE